MSKTYFVYILSNKKNGTLYVGVTSHISGRIFSHKSKSNDGFTKKYDISKLVHYEMFADPVSAIKREKLLKNWNRDWKIKLIEKNNPEWRDLYSEVAFYNQ